MWQHFFKSEKRILNPYILKLKDNEDYVIYDAEKMQEKKGKWNEFFGNKNPIYFEIGSGAGNFTVRNAEKYINKNYIAVELKFKRLVMSAEKARKRDLKNLIFLRKRGELLLDILGENEIDGLYINFPDPWDTKNREKNRIVSLDLFEKLKTVLKKNGKIYFKTDHYEYYLDVLEKTSRAKGYKVIYKTDDLYSSEKASENISTEFEDLFRNKEMKINYIEIEKEV